MRLELFSLPDIVWTLSPAVSASLVNAILTLSPVEKTTLAHIYHVGFVPNYACGDGLFQLRRSPTKALYLLAGVPFREKMVGFTQLLCSGIMAA